MKVLVLKTKKTLEVNESFGARLIEQGKAILPPVSAPVKAVKEPKEPKPAAKEPRKKGDA